MTRSRPQQSEAEGAIRAAGAVLWRRSPDGAVKVALVHRPRYDDWSFPKGKAHAGEDALATAIREVGEETGQRVRPGAALGETRYLRAHDGVEREKVVTYWAMEALGGGFEAGAETDEVRWLEPEAAAALLTYDRDRALLRRFSALSP